MFKTVREFSSDLNKFLYRDGVVDMLPGCGWNDGGCRSLMKAMMIWLGDIAEPYQIVMHKNDMHSEHAFVKVGNYFIDGDGACTRGALYNRWKNAEGLPHVIIRPFDPKTEPRDRTNNPPYYMEDAQIRYLAKLLATKYDKRIILRLLTAA